MSYARDIRIEFNHCDPAGIVFYPRYFEMTNSVVENFFREHLDYPFSRMSLQEKRGVPTVRLACDFHRPSFLGDVVRFGLEVRRIGRSSVDFTIDGHCGDERRMSCALTLVWIDADGRPDPWPARVREALKAHLTPRNME